MNSLSVKKLDVLKNRVGIENKKAVLVFGLSIMLSFFSEAAFSSSWGTKSNWSDLGSAGSSTAKKSKKVSSDEDAPIPAPFSPGSNNLALDMGQVMLMGDLSKFQNNLGAAVHYSYGVSDLFAFDASFGYSEHMASFGGPGALINTSGAPGEMFSMASLMTGVRTNLNWYDKIIPYVSFGVGFYRPSIKIDPNTSISNILFGLYAGPGVDLQISDRVFFGASLALNSIFGSSMLVNNQPISLGGTYANFMVHAGVSF